MSPLDVDVAVIYVKKARSLRMILERYATSKQTEF
jgi:hypothetical protein